MKRKEARKMYFRGHMLHQDYQFHKVLQVIKTVAKRVKVNQKKKGKKIHITN